MRVLVTGASGFVGGHLCQQLIADGHEVRAAVRFSGSSPVGTEELVVGDLGANIDWGDALKEVDAIVHLAARVHLLGPQGPDALSEFRRINVNATVALAEHALRSGVERFVFMSSIAVNGSRSADPLDILSKPAPTGAYGQSKWEAEQALEQISDRGSMSLISVRVPMVYGPHAPGNVSRLVRMATSGLPIPLGKVDNRRTLIGIQNLSELLVECATRPALGSGLVVAGDEYSPSTAELFKEVALAHDRKPNVWPLPVPLLSILATLTGRRDDFYRLTDSLEVKNSSTVPGFSWQPAVSFHRAIRGLGLKSGKGLQP